MVEVTRKAFLASLVPVIVDAILNEHQVVVDIVAFVSRGDFPRSRLGEKQRGKVLASWVTRKLRTIAQFSIRDVEGAANPFAETPQPRASKSSKPGSIMGNSLRRSTLVPDDVPRSPAPVPEEVHELQSDPRPDVQEMDEYFDMHHHPAGTQDTMTPIPQIAEPTSATSAEMAGASSGLDQLDFGSDFGDLGPATGSGQSAELSTEGDVAEPPGLQLPQGRDSLPSQKRLSSLPGNTPLPERKDSHMPRQPEYHDESVEDWPQEALMYQSTWGIDGAHDEGVHRNPTNASEAARRRYDGSDYGF